MQPRSHSLTSPTTRWGCAPGRPLVGRDTELAELCQQLEPPGARLREVYAALVDSDQFRTACGRISASYAW